MSKREEPGWALCQRGKSVPARYISTELGFRVGGGACPVNEPDYITDELQNCYDVVTIPHCPGPIGLGLVVEKKCTSQGILGNAEAWRA
jgi:hypothetical protein